MSREVTEEAQETHVSAWAEEHPWLALVAATEDEDSVDEVIRYTLDELRLA